MKRDPSQWIALVISLVSLLASGMALYYQFFWQHDSFQALILNKQSGQADIRIDVLVWNGGNHIEVLGSLKMVDGDAELAKSAPLLLKPGDANIVSLDYRVPRSGMPRGYLRKSTHVAALASYYSINAPYELPLELRFSIVNFKPSMRGLPSGPKTIRYYVAVGPDRKPTSLVAEGDRARAPLIDLYQVYVNSF